MSRRRVHAYHDFSGAQESSRTFLPEEVMINKRLESMNLQPGVTPPQSEQLPPTAQVPPLINQIPGAQAPQIVSLNGKFKSSIPSIPEEREWIQEVNADTGNVFTTFKDVIPPPADCVYKIMDKGVSGPNFFRSSMYNCPNTEKLRQSLGLPMALVIRPMANGNVPQSDFRGSEPPRCARCRAYMNPSMRFLENGNKFVCNLCMFTNHTPPDYYQPTDMANRRIDWASKSELSFGTYEFQVDGSYGPPTEPMKHIFLCETTTHAQKAALPSFIAAVKRSIEYTPPECPIAIAIFDHQFKPLRFKGPQDNQIEMQTYTPSDAMIPPPFFTKNRDHLHKILDNLYNCCLDATAYSCFGSFIEPLVKSMPHGGRISTFISSLPLVEPFKLKQRDPLFAGLGDTKRPPHPPNFQQEHKQFKQLNTLLQTSGVAHDLFVINPPATIDLVTLKPIVDNSGGRLFYYPAFAFERDVRRVINDLLSCTTPPLTSARNCSLAVRVSTGLQLQDTSQQTLLHLPKFMDGHITTTVFLKHDSYLDPKLDVHFQAALLYTDEQGQRKVRVFNLMAGVTDRHKLVVKFVDIDVLTKAILEESLQEVAVRELHLIREAIRAKIIDIFSKMRITTGSGMPQSTMLMPSAYRELIMRALALTKTSALGTHLVSLDSRAAQIFDLNAASFNELSLMLYPRIYDLHTRDILPAKQSSLLNSSGCCLVFNGKLFYLWLVKESRPSMLMDLFGCPSLEEINPFMDELPILETEINVNARELMAELPIRVGKSWVPMQLARQSFDGAEHFVRRLMVEDPCDDAPAYRDFVIRVHEHARDAEAKHK